MSVANEARVKVKSVTFKEAVRLPGSSSTSHYIPSADYPLTWYPQLGLLEARLKSGVRAIGENAARRFYGIANVKDLDVDESALPPETAVREQNGVLVVPTSNVRMGANGTFERVTDEEPAAAPVEAVEEAAPKPRKKPGPKPKAKAGAEPAPTVDRSSLPGMANLPHAGRALPATRNDRDGGA